mgnify:CR=1 FL=1
MGAWIDDLNYSCQSGTSRLGSITDAVAGTSDDWDAEDATFGYDVGGNLASQSGKLTDIGYDHRNLPVHFWLSSGAEVVAGYNAGGRRILKELKDGAWQFYVQDGQQTLAVIEHSGFSHFNLVGNSTFGRWEPGGARPYYITDHLRSTRAVVDSNGTVLETFDYYPFGLLMPKRNTTGANTLEKFTGKEHDEAIGLDYFGARYFDPALGRWHSVDPILQEGTTDILIADGYLSINPYNYVFNNSFNLFDPDGKMACEPEKKCLENQSSTNQILESIRVNFNEIDLSFNVSAFIGFTETLTEETIKGTEKAIEVSEAVGDGADVAELTFGLLAVPTEGATLPAVGVSNTTSIIADLNTAGLKGFKATLQNRSYSEAGLKLFEGGAGAVTNSYLNAAGRTIASKTNNVTGAVFRSNFTGRYIRNYAGYAATVGGPTAAGFALMKTIFGF